MIHSRISAKAQTTIPLAVRRALRVGPGDDIGYEIQNGRVSLVRLTDDEPMISNFSTFTEWADEHDSVFDNL